MNLTNNTILIINGDKGIGFEIAKLFSCLRNHIILISENSESVKKSAAILSNTVGFAYDLSNDKDIERLVKMISYSYIDMNILINCFELEDDLLNMDSKEAQVKIDSKYSSHIKVVDSFISLLHYQGEAAIINITPKLSCELANAFPLYLSTLEKFDSYILKIKNSIKSSEIRLLDVALPFKTIYSKDLKVKKRLHEQTAKDIITHFLDVDVSAVST